MLNDDIMQLKIFNSCRHLLISGLYFISHCDIRMAKSYLAGGSEYGYQPVPWRNVQQD